MFSNEQCSTGRTPFLRFIFCLLLLLSPWSSATEASLETAIELYFKGDYAAAKPLLEDAQGCCKGEALYYLALITKTKGNSSAAIPLYRKSAQSGFEPAMSALSDLYANGEGVNKDLILATDWSRKAKHAGRTAKFDIEITTVNTNKQSNLVTHWQQKADLGDVDALYRLARIYDDGVITTHNLDIAVNYYKKAANAGHAMSQYTLGYLYCRGEGVKKDIEKSNQWLSKYSTELHCHYFKDEK